MFDSEPKQPFSDEIRVRNQQARLLHRGAPISEDEFAYVTRRWDLDPLTFIVIGYRMALSGHLDTWMKHRSADACRFLPDFHILRAVFDDGAGRSPGDIPRSLGRTEPSSLSSAMRGRLPLLQYGFHWLTRWLTLAERNYGNTVFVRPLPQLTMTPWTALDARPSTAPLHDDEAIEAEALLQSEHPWSERLRPAIARTVFLYGPHRRPTSGFIAPDGTIVTSDRISTGEPGGGRPTVAVRPSAPTNMSDRAESPGSRRADPENHADAQHDVVMTARFAGAALVTSTETASTTTVLDDVSGDDGRVIRLLADSEVIEATNTETLEKFAEVPSLGQRVAVVGVLQFSRGAFENWPEEAFRLISNGRVSVLPGEVTSVDPISGVFECSCVHSPSVDGGPIVDLDTGALVGIQVGFAGLGIRKRSTGLSITRLNFGTEYTG